MTELTAKQMEQQRRKVVASAVPFSQSTSHATWHCARTVHSSSRSSVSNSSAETLSQAQERETDLHQGGWGRYAHVCGTPIKDLRRAVIESSRPLEVPTGRVEGWILHFDTVFKSIVFVLKFTTYQHNMY
eukprot:2289834-Amphidinium_carterae.1